MVYSFCRKANCADGDLPSGALLQGTNGSFYGAASFGGSLPTARRYSVAATAAAPSSKSLPRASLERCTTFVP